ncbi:MAG: DUF4331 domain-containing protein [Erythrobacter sp.]|nr:DUF4331 domain-containing protein [Erythrobacter sp.]
MRNFVFVSMLALAAAVAVPVAFLSGEKPAPAADHLDPPARTNPNNDSTPDFPADIADLYVTHDDQMVTMIVTFGGPAATSLPAMYDADLLFTISVSNQAPRTTTDIPIVFQFGRETGVADGPWGVRVRGVPGVEGDIVGSVERIIEKDGVRVFAGLTDDPFFFDSQGLTETRQTGTLSFRNNRDFFGAQNITAFAIQIPRDRLENGTNELDFWTFSDRRGGQI